MPINVVMKVLFQFHKGTIKTVLFLRNIETVSHFNSIKVRLKQAGVTQLGSEPKVSKSLNDSLKPSDIGSRDNTGITSALGESADARLKKVTEGVDGLFG